MSSITFAAARAVVSYPLPAVFGTMKRRPEIGSLAGADPAPGSPRFAVAPQPLAKRAAAATTAAPSFSRLNIVVPLLR